MRATQYAPLWATMLAAISGCEYRIQDCTPEEEAYISAAQDWVRDHPDLITAEMDKNWTGERDTSFEAILGSLTRATLQCGVGRHESDQVAASELPGDRIVIDVSEAYFQENMALWEKRRWVTEYTPVELGDPTIIDPAEHVNPLQEYLEYNVALGSCGLLFTHESAHTILGDHTKEAKKRLKQIAAPVDPVTTKNVDEIYAWGYATLVTANDISEAAVQEAYADGPPK